MKHLFEGTTHLLKNISSTAACQTAHPFRRGWSIYNWNPGTRQRRLSVLTTSSSRTGSTQLNGRDARCYSTRRLFSLDVNFKSIYLHDTRREMPETQTGFYRACCHVPLFVDNLSAAKKHSRSCRYTSVTFAPRNVAWERSLSITIRAVMLDEQVDLEAGDFSGAGMAVRQQEQQQYHRRSLCRLRLADASRPHTVVGDLDRFRATGLTFVGS